MIKSVYLKLVFAYFSIMLIGNIAVFIIFSMSIEKTIIAEVDNKISDLILSLQDLYKEDSNKNSIEKFLELNYIRAVFLKDSKDIKNNQYIVEFFSKEKLDAFFENNEDNMYIKKRNALFQTIPAVLMKLNNGNDFQYLFIYTDATKMSFNFMSTLVKLNFFSMLFAMLMILIATKYIVEPIKKLSLATKKISSGNFDVYINDDRKDEIGQLIEGFNTMAHTLKNIEITRNDFVSSLSHEFRTPLTSIEGYTKLLADCDDKAEKKEYADIITEETRRLSNLSNNILLLNRIESENIILKKECFRLDEQIRKSILLLENRWSEKNIDMDITLDEVTYFGNEQLLFQVWINLIDNSIKFSQNGSKLEISLEDKNKSIKFRIKDYGIGIPKDSIDRIFDKFYKIDESRNGDGNGLGLSIVKKIVDMHKGEIHILSEVKKGTEIIISM